MSKRLTTAEFKQKIYNLVGNDYSLIGEYINRTTKVTLKHNKCGYVYQVLPSNFYNGTRCPKCAPKRISKTKTKSADEYAKEFYQEVGNEYTIIIPYKNARTKIKIKHNKCGYVYWVNPQSFLAGSRCSKCARADRTHTTTWFKEKVKDLTGDEYSVLGTYVDSGTKIKVKHNKCGYVYWVRPRDFIRGNRCPIQHKAYKKTTAEFQKDLDLKYGSGVYLVLGTYINRFTKLEIKHLKCGHIWETTPNNLLSGYGCDRCGTASRTNSEPIVRHLLDQLKVNYKYHQHFWWLRYKGPQHLDFYFPDKKIAIEIDGLQHSKNINYFNNNLIKNKLRDKNKDILCKKHGVQLIRIPYKGSHYTEDLKGEVLKVLKQYNLLKDGANDKFK